MNATLSAFLDPTSPILLSTTFLFGILKALFLIGFGVYVVFAFAVVRQIVLMTRTLQTGLNISFTIFGWVHFLAAIVVWLIAFFTL